MSHNLRLLKTRKNNQWQVFRPRPEGPDKVICTVIEKATGRSLTSAFGSKTRKRSAAGVAKREALLRLKRVHGVKYNPKLHEFTYV